ncbi:TNFAIP3-interacting protein 3-like [Sciurus carolinensis]|uniref:TNFAIP3-interacting protein 3-like n=1 Tax=Sciurus carolinensis TaxID=30640 RepID=UPI001FB35ECA|nr:TNFAIP3-interacting protein 3-like [Sciurus carolinensis]
MEQHVCESMEQDNKIWDLIERNASPDPKDVPAEGMLSHRNACPPKCAQSSRRKNVTDPLEQKIMCLEKQRKELLEVNQQWEQQIRSMKELYERKVAELRTKLSTVEDALGSLKCERLRSQSAGGAAQDLRQEENEELQELKKENKFLKETNALTLKKEHYECETQHPNKSGPSWEGYWGKCMEHSHVAMRTEVEVFRQQVQICEEDFRKEQSDWERLNQEKEELCGGFIKLGPVDQAEFPACICGSTFHLWDPWVPAGRGAVQDQQECPGSKSSHFNK